MGRRKLSVLDFFPKESGPTKDMLSWTGQEAQFALLQHAAVNNIQAKDEAASAAGGAVTLSDAFHTPTKQKMQEATKRARTALEASLENKAKKRRVSLSESVPVPVAPGDDKPRAVPLQLDFSSPASKVE